MKLKLNKDQLKKIAANLKKGLGSKIRIKPNQIGVGIEYPFTTKQNEDLEKYKKNGNIVLFDLSIKKTPKTGGSIGGFLPALAVAAPYIFGGLTSLGALMGGISSIKSTIDDKKYKDKLNEEQERHNKVIEKIISEKTTSVHVGSNLKKKKPKKKVHFQNPRKKY